jgi:hypothetical protein
MASLEELNSNLKNAVTNIGRGVIAIENAFPRITGSFTLAAATTTVVAQPATASNSIVTLTATNTTAALTQRTLGLFHSANAPGVSFSVSTQGGAAAGTETFEYLMVNPA